MNWGQVTPYYAGPRRVVIVDKLRHEVIQVPLAEDNELAQALQLDRLNEPLASAVQIWARHWQRIGPGSATAVNGGPKVRRGGVAAQKCATPAAGIAATALA